MDFDTDAPVILFLISSFAVKSLKNCSHTHNSFDLLLQRLLVRALLLSESRQTVNAEHWVLANFIIIYKFLEFF